MRNRAAVRGCAAKNLGAGTRRTADKGSSFPEVPKIKVEHYSQHMATGVSKFFYKVLAVFVPSDLTLIQDGLLIMFQCLTNGSSASELHFRPSKLPQG
jgi:hypothetical protein